MTDIKIPKRSFAGFVLGVATALLLLFCIGAVLAATVFNAGGGTIANLGAPSASGDIATKGYADAATARTCVPKGDAVTFANTGTTTVCTGCSGRVSMVEHYTSGASGSTACRLNIDGTAGQLVGGQYNSISTFHIYAAEFATNLTVTGTDTTAGYTYCTVYYCLDS